MTQSDCYFVLTPDDVIAHVSEALHGTMGAFVGHSVWVRMPRSELVFRPYFQVARQTGEEVQCVAFYAGGTVELRIVPSGESLTVYPARLAMLNIRTLATLKASLEKIVAELAAPGSLRSDRPAPASLRALP